MLEAEIVNKQRQKCVQWNENARKRSEFTVKNLSKEPRYWFLEKMQLVNGFDPYGIPTKEWTGVSEN